LFWNEPGWRPEIILSYIEGPDDKARHVTH